MKKAFQFYIRVALLGLLAGWPAAAQPALRFLAIGDAGSGTQMQKDVAAQMANYADASRSNAPVRFVLVLGDNFYESGVVNVSDPQWQTKFEQMYDPKRLDVPFFAVLGNHDWRGGLPDVEIDYAKAHPQSRWQMDGHYYKRQFDLGKTPAGVAAHADFFFIDTQAWNPRDSHVTGYTNQHLGMEQMAWLEKELSASTATWKFVSAHHPLYSNGDHGHDADVLNLRKRLGPLFTKDHVDIYFTGHDHDLQRIETPECPTLFIVSGAAGKLRTQKFNDWQPFHASAPGFAAITLSATELHGEFIDARGKVLDSWRRTPLAAKNNEAAEGQSKGH